MSRGSRKTDTCSRHGAGQGSREPTKWWRQQDVNGGHHMACVVNTILVERAIVQGRVAFVGPSRQRMPHLTGKRYLTCPNRRAGLKTKIVARVFLALENVALRQQLAVLERSGTHRPRTRFLVGTGVLADIRVAASQAHSDDVTRSVRHNTVPAGTCCLGLPVRH